MANLSPPDEVGSLPALPLPRSLTSTYIDCTSSCGLKFHTLQAGEPGRPLVLFAHGFPELAYSWRHVLPSVAAAGYYCVAMDQRGYGRTTGWSGHKYDEADLNDFVLTNLVRDLVCLVYALGYTEVRCIVGHDFGAVSSAMAALMRPDIFTSTVQMSHPHHGPPKPPLGTVVKGAERLVGEKQPDVHEELAKLDPPRKHYKWYNSTPSAAADWDDPPQGLTSFLRGYFHLKSADWAGNEPHPLEAWDARHLVTMPEYYIMPASLSMPDTVARNMSTETGAVTERWLPPSDLAVYVSEWTRTGFQGALNWYRAQTAPTPQARRDMLLFAGRRLEVPCAFISGAKDWGNYQQPGALQESEDTTVVKEGMFKGTTMVPRAGHWVQQEQPEAVVKELLGFLGKP